MGKIFTNNMMDRFKHSISRNLLHLNILLFLISVSSHVLAEGTKQLVPDPTKNYGQLQIWDNISAGTRVFMTYAATNIPLKHLNIKVCNVGERVYIGFTSLNNDVFFRVKDPNGNTVPLSSVSSSTGIATLMTPVNKPNNYTSLYVNSGGSIINASASALPAPNAYTYRMGYTSGMPGYIANYNEAVTGPAVPAVATANGYPVANGYKKPIFFIATATGDYFLEVNPIFPDSLVTSGTYATTSKRVFPYFDITVTDQLNKIKPGRVWSGFWDMTTNSMTNYFAGSFYVYTTDSIVTKLKFNNIGPNGFVVMCNSFGLTNTGNFVKDRQSAAGNFGEPEYKLFLVDPDNSCYPTGVFGQLNSAPNITGCNVNNRCINIDVTKSGKAQIILQLSTIPGLVDRAISYNLQKGSNCVLWDTRDGAGNLVPAGATFNIQIQYYTGITHLPIFDVEFNLAGYSVTLIRPLLGGVAVPYMFWDDTQIPLIKNVANGSLTQIATPYPGSPQIPGNWLTMGGTPVPYPLCGVGALSNAANTGYSPYVNTITNSVTQCASITNGCTTATGCYNGLQVINTVQGCVNLGGCHLWNWGGDNSSLTDYGNNNTINMWWYANILTTAAGFNPGYITVNADTRIPRKVDANGKVKVRDTTICANNNIYNLSGLISSTGFVGSITGFWKTALPKALAGKFSDSTSMTGTYTPSATDLASDSAKIYLYATNASCPTGAIDSLIIRYSPSPKIFITAPSNVCGNNSTINLSSGLTVASGIVWGGSISGVGPLTGTFSPPTSLTPTYTLGAGESPSYGSSKLLIFIATTTGNGKCNPVISSQVIVTVNPAFTVSIPGTASICSSQANLLLKGNITNGIITTTGLWSTNGTGTFTGGFSTTTVLSTTYYFSSADVSNNGVTLSLISTGNGNCNASAGQIVVSMYGAPTASVITNPTVCNNNPTATISGTVSNATSILWSDLTGPVGTFSPSSTVLGISYTPSSTEIASQSSVTLQLQAFESGCVPASSTALITIDKAPTLSPSTTQFVCANNATVTLTSSVFQSSTGEGTGAVWSGNGGTFFPSNIITPTTTGITYTLSSTEISKGSTVLVLTSTGNKTCLPVTSSVTVFVSTAPTIAPLSNVNVCVNNPTVSLTGSVNSPFTGSWSTTGNGTISGIGSNIVYTASAIDISNGTVPFTYTSSTLDATHSVLCKAVSQTVNLTFTSSPSVSAGSNRTVCANNASLTLNGGVTGAAGVTWIGGTSASFSPSRNVISPTYTPTSAEIASGLLTLSVTSTGNPSNCYADLKAMNIAFTPAPTVNPGSSFNVCSNNANISLHGSVIIGNVTSTGVWSGGNGGSYNPINNVNTVYTPSSADISSGAVLFTLTPNNVGNCIANPASLLVGFTSPPSVNPGITQTICSSIGFVNLNGSITYGGTSTTGIWSGGSGTFSPADPTVLKTKYFPTPSEISAGTVSLVLTSTSSSTGCNAVSSTVAINFSQIPVVSAGSNQTICGNNFSPITFSGTAKNAQSVLWTYNGVGNFTNRNTLTPTYTPNTTDKTNGAVIFKLTASGGSCAAVSDSFTVSFSNAPVANAGGPINICTNAFPVQLNASGSQGTWSGPSANYSPNNSAFNAQYTPTSSQTVTGSFTLTYTTNATAGCSPVSSTVTINVSQGPTVKAGNKLTVCANSPNASLSGTAFNVVGQKWSSSGTGTFTSSTSLNTIYQPSNADILNGRVLLTLQSQGGSCGTATDTLSLIITPAPSVVSMASQSICSNTSTLTLAGTVAVAGGGLWSTSGSGKFSGNTLSSQSITGSNLNSDYTPSAGDISLGSVTLSLTSISNGLCSPVTKTFNLSFSQAPVVVAGTTRNICSNKDTLQLNGQISNAVGGIWSTSGTGSFDNFSKLNAIYTPSSADLASSSFKLTLVSTGNNGSCTAASSSITFNVTSKPNPSAGGNTTICADVSSINLNGSINLPYGGIWSTSGSGTFTGPVATTSSINTVYTPSIADLNSGSFTLFFVSTGGTVCGSVFSKSVYTVTPKPIVNPGSDLTICADVSGVLLSGTIQNASGGIWTTTAPGGQFVPNSPVGNLNSSNQLNAIYQPSAALKASGGTVVLTLTNITSGTCNNVSKSILLNVTQKPSITANSVGPVCADTVNIPVSGVVTNVSTLTGNYTWTSDGSGVYTPSSSPLSILSGFVPATYYQPSLTDKTNGSVNLTVTSNGNGTCAPVSSTVPLVITPAPVISAGQNKTVCASAGSIQLNGTSNAVATAYQWLTSGNGTFSGTNILNPVYTFSATDKSAGQVKLTLQSTAQGNCKPVSSSITIKIVPQPVANAGSPISICVTTSVVGLSGSITTVSGGGVWSTAGTGSFSPNSNTLNAKYIPSAADFANGSVKLTLSTLNSGSCPEVSNSVQLTFLSKPVVKAGADQSICADASGLTLSGSVTGAGGGLWTSRKLGTFSPNANTLNATYKPSAAAISAQKDTLYLTSTGSAPCTAITDTLIVNINPVPTVTAGPNAEICNYNDVSYTLSAASVTGAAGIVWSTSGNGNFVPSDSTTNPFYNNTASDVSAGTVILTATTYGNGPCKAKSASMKLKFDQLPSVSAGPIITYCVDANPAQTIQLNGTVNGQSTTTTVAGYNFEWNTNGSGSFVDNTQFTPNYIPSDLDKLVGNIQFTFSAINSGSACGSTSSSTNVYLTPPPFVSGQNISVCPDADSIYLTGDNHKYSLHGSYGVMSVKILSPGVISNGAITAYGVNFSASTITIPGWNDIGDGFFANGTTTATGATFYNNPVPDWTLVSSGLYTSGGVTVTNSNNFLNGTATILGYTYDPTSGFYISGTTSATGASFVNGTYLPSPWYTIDSTTTSKTFSNGLATVTGGAFWTTTSPGGSFIPSNTLMSSYYKPTAADKANGQVVVTINSTGFATCTPVKQDIVITFIQSPTVISGPSQYICANNPTVSLSGSVIQGTTTFTGVSGIANWSCPTGGTFTSSNFLSTTFIPTPAQISSGQAVVFLTSSPTATVLGGCATVKSSTTIYFTQPTSINAGSSILTCRDASSVTLNGSVGIASVGGIWTTSGTGIFSNTTSLSTIYTPSVADKANGNVLITLSSSNNGNCNLVQSTVNVSFTPSPTVVGSNLTVCADAGSVALSGFPTFITVPGWSYFSNGYTNGTSTITGGVTWTTTSPGGTFSNVLGSISSTSYNFTSTDIANGSVVVKLSTNGFGTCQTSSANYIVTILPKPTVNLSAPATVCGVSGAIALSGTVTGANGGLWSSASGDFGTPGVSSITSSGTNFNVNFNPSASQLSSGKAVVQFTTANNGSCNAVSKSVTIVFQTPPLISAGSNISTCSVPSINLTGSVSLPAVSSTSNPIWSSNGTGSFSLTGNTISGSQIQNVYYPSSADVTTGNIQICMISTANGICVSNALSCLTVGFVSSPGYSIVNPTPTICGNNLPILLSASGPVGTWSGGAGTITGANSLNASYIPTFAEINAGATIVFTITSSGICGVTPPGHITVTLIPGPTIGGLSTPTYVCKNNTVLDLSAVTVSGATSGIWYTTGNGKFFQNNTTVGGQVLTYGPTLVGGALTYIPSTNDITGGNVDLKFVTSNNLNGCKSDSSIIDLIFTPVPVVYGGGNQSYCANVSTITLTGSVTLNGTTASGLTASWTSTSSGTLTSNQSGTSVIGVFSPSLADIASGSTKLYLISNLTTPGICNQVKDSVVVTFNQLPFISGLSTQTVCGDGLSNIQLQGNLSAVSNVVWSGGLGTFTPNRNTLNAFYKPAATETGSVQLFVNATSTGSNCVSSTSTVNLAIQAQPTINAGGPYVICSNNLLVNLSASGTGLSGLNWSTVSGQGYGFLSAINTTTGTATYNATLSDVTSGGVSLNVISLGNGVCNAVSANTGITFIAPPSISAGGNKLICSNNPTVTLTGTFSGASPAGVQWSLGSLVTGTFTGATTSTSIVFTASSTATPINIYISSTGVNICNQVKDSLTLQFSPSPVISGVNSAIVCGDTSGVILNATVSVASGLTWSGGTGLFVPNRNSLNPTYISSSSEANGSVVNFTLTTTGNGNCNYVQSSMTLTITSMPTITAPSSVVTCATNRTITLSGVGLFSNATGAVWSTSGTGTFSGVNTTTGFAVYTASQKDSTNGGATFQIKTVGNGLCKSVSDTANLTITPAPIINAGLTQSLCVDNDTIKLDGSISPYASFGNVWSALGGATGTFVGVNSLQSSYIISSSDRALSGIVFSLAPATVGSCNAALAIATVEVSFTPAPVVTVTSALSAICANDSSVALTGLVTIGNTTSSGVWSGGSGTFSPSAALSTPKYILSTLEANTLTTTSIPLIYTSNNNGSCIGTYTATVNLVVNPSPNVIPPTSFVKPCQNNPNVTLTATSINASLTWSSTSNNPGTFTPVGANQGTTINYQPSAQEFTAGSVNMQIVATSTFAGCSNKTIVFPVSLDRQPLAQAIAGSNLSICKDQSVINLVGYVVNADPQNSTWLSTSGGGSFTSFSNVAVPGLVNTYQINASYSVSSFDIANGNVGFTLDAAAVAGSTCFDVNSSILATFLDLPTITATSSVAMCADTNLINLTASISTAASGVIWSGGNGTFSNASQLSTNYLPSTSEVANGQVGLTVTTLNTNGCTNASQNITLTINPLPKISVLASSITACANTSGIPLTGYLTNVTSAQWSGGLGTFVPVNSTTTSYTPSASDVASGTVDVKITAYPINTCKPISKSIAINFEPVPVVNAGVNQTKCMDELSATLNGLINGVATTSSYVRWTTTGSGFFADPTSSNTTYTFGATDIPVAGSVSTVKLQLTYSDPIQCGTISSFVVLTITSTPVVTASIQEECTFLTGIPLVGNVTFNNSSSTGIWSTSGSGTFDQTAGNPSALYVPSATDISNGGATLTFSSTNQGTCSPASATVKLIIKQLPVSLPGNDQTVCVGSTVVLVGNANTNVSYSWYKKLPSGMKSLITNNKVANVTVNSNTTFYLVVTDANGCQNTDSVIVNTIIPPNLGMLPHDCYFYLKSIKVSPSPNSPASLGITSGLPTYDWYRNDSLIASISDSIGILSPSISMVAAGYHKLVFNYLGCSVSKIDTVTLPPVITGKDRTLCVNSNATLSVTPISKAVYNWTYNGSGPVLSTASSLNTNVQNGYYLVSVTDSLGCPGSDTIKVKAVPVPLVNVKPVTACLNDTAVLNGIASNIDTSIYSPSYRWYRAGYLFYADTTHSKINVTSGVGGSGEYKLVYSIGECVVADSANIAFNPIPKTNLIRERLMCIDSDSATGIVLDAGDGVTYKWKSPTDPKNKKFYTGDSSRTIIAHDTVTYYVQVFNQYKCSVKDSVVVSNACEPHVFPADAFTPNNDQTNDTYYIHYKYIDNFKFTVFSRWGEIIYYTEDPNKPWDGNFKGDPMPAGVYPWTLEYTGNNRLYKGPYKRQGKVTVIR